METQKHIPPIVGEYCYFDHKLQHSKSAIINSDRVKYWKVKTEDGIFFCHYSKPMRDWPEQLIENRGRILEILDN